MTDNAIALHEMIAALRTELAVAKTEGKDALPRFRIEDTEIEVQVTVTRDSKKDGSIKFWVFNAGVEGKNAQQTAITVKLKMSVLDSSGAKMEIKDQE